ARSLGRAARDWPSAGSCRSDKEASMNKKTQRVIVIVLALAMLASVLVPALGMLAAASISQSDIDNLENQLNDISQQKESVEAELEAIQDDLTQSEEQVELIQAQLVL